MGHVRGPFIEYECTKCGVTVQMAAHPNQEKLREVMLDKNTNPDKRRCASCHQPADKASK